MTWSIFIHYGSFQQLYKISGSQLFQLKVMDVKTEKKKLKVMDNDKIT